MTITECRNRFLALNAERHLAYFAGNLTECDRIDHELDTLLDEYNSSRPPSTQPPALG